jgi:ribA/ribD-fused uncharacterized protein
MNMIDHFDGDFKFLSNFYPVEVMYENIVYPSVEHAYQAAKTDDLARRLLIRNLETAGQAKREGGKVKLYPDWHIYKRPIMSELLKQKFTKPELRALLMATEGHDLVEGNYWGDTYWGIYNGKGHNYLGKLLMSIRNGISMGIL